MNLRHSEGIVSTLPATAVIARGHAVSIAGSGNTAQKMSGSGQTFVGIALGTETRGGVQMVNVLRRGEVSLSVSGTEPTNWLGAIVYWDGTNNLYTFASTGNTAVGRVVNKEGSLYRVVLTPAW